MARWPNGGHGPHVSQSQVDSLSNHSGGDDHHERAVRMTLCCGDLTSSLSLKCHFCWHCDLSLDGESHKCAHCHFHLHSHGKGEKMVSSQAVACQHFCLKWSKIVTSMSASYVSSCPKEGVKESPRPINGLLIGIPVGH